MSSKKSQIANKILDRLKVAYNLKKDAHLAALLGVAPNTITTWRSRNTVDFRRILAKCDKVNLHWLLTGEGPIRPPVTRDTVLRDRIESNKEGLDLYEVIEEVSGKVTIVTKDEMEQIHKLLRILKSGDAELVEAVKSCLREFERLSGLISAHFGDIILLERRVRQIPIDFPDRRKSKNMGA